MASSRSVSKAARCCWRPGTPLLFPTCLGRIAHVTRLAYTGRCSWRTGAVCSIAGHMLTLGAGELSQTACSGVGAATPLLAFEAYIIPPDRNAITPATASVWIKQAACLLLQVH